MSGPLGADEYREVASRVEGLMVEWIAHTQHLAEQSRDTEGNLRCCACGTAHGLVCVGKGWGGVFACRDCAAATEVSS